MTSIHGAINSLNQFTYTAGAVQGAAQAMVPALYAVDQSIHQVASVFTGDTYQTTPYYPAPAPATFGGESKMGLVGSLVAGGAAAGFTHTQTANALRSFKFDGFAAGMKNLGMAGLKAGAIGAAVTGVFSGVRNFAAANRGEMTKADAGGQTAADTVGGLLAGTGAGLAGGIASMALGKFGLVGTIGAVAVGALGAVGVNKLYEASGVRDGIASSMRKAFGGSDPVPQTAAYAPYYGY
jgi:hypothetical protein